MKILTLFCGNFGIEYNLFDFTDKQLTNLITGIITDIGSRTADNRYECKGISKHDIREVSNVIAALKWINDTLVKEGFITTPDDIDAVVHRVIHGLTKYRKELVKVTPEVIDDVLEFADFAPEHNPYNAEGMKAALTVYPHAEQFAFFDTAPFVDLPAKAYMYGLPYQFYTQYHIRRYGFHGISHLCGIGEACKLIGKSMQRMKIISLYLGRGVSMAAFDKGKAIDTSMGFSPLEGLIMKMRSGNVDPQILLYLASREGLSLIEIGSILNKSSGLLGLIGTTDIGHAYEEATRGNEQARLGLDTFVYQIQKYFGAYYVALKGVDLLVFIARDEDVVPQLWIDIVKGLEFMGATIDETKAYATVREEPTILSTDKSKFAIIYVPRHEECCMAKRVAELLQR